MELLHTAKRLIIKVGSLLVLNEERDRICKEWISSLARDIAFYHQQGKEIILVSSGAVAVGRTRLRLSRSKNLKPEEKQAAAATGQMLLSSTYQSALARYDIALGQILITREDTEIRRRHLHVRDAINTLLKFHIIPFINENDSIITSEIRVGDNDRLAARVAQMVSADTLVLLSNIDGFYTANPFSDTHAVRIPVIKTITPAIEEAATDTPHEYSLGGMVTKLAAARIAMNAGCRMVITLGRSVSPLSCLDQGVGCTWFLPSSTPLTARKRWIAGHLQSLGTMVIDNGAVEALKKGRSLLPVGVTSLEGTFERGDLVVIHNPTGQEIARGLSSYSVEDARAIIGKKSPMFSSILGYNSGDELVHRDNLVLLSDTLESHD